MQEGRPQLPASRRRAHQRRLVWLWILLIVPLLGGCLADARRVVTPAAVNLMRRHYRQHLALLEEFGRRLYAKNPCYEPDPVARKAKLASIFHGAPALEGRFFPEPSHRILAAAFSREVKEDRIYLLVLGLAKGIREAYEPVGKAVFLAGLQVELQRLQRLHCNISNANWRLKTRRDAGGNLFFRSNEPGEGGYINMGYEVIITTILTRIEDDIYLRGGLPGRYVFDVSSLFVSVVL